MNVEGRKENERILSELNRTNKPRESRSPVRSVNNPTTSTATSATATKKVDNSFKRNMKDFFGGLFGGVLGVCLSHPFDTLRVRLQSANVSATPSVSASLSNFKISQMSTLFSSLYKGFVPPLLGVGGEKFIVFGTYNWCHRTLFPNQDTMLSTFVSGAASGATCTIVVTPVERLKIQMQNGGKFSLSHLAPTSLYRGWSATLCREIPGFGLYFSYYKAFKQIHPIDKSTTVGYFLPFLYGGLSGALTWVFIYPADLIKTKIQADNYKYNNWTTCVKDVMRTEGIRGFYRGFQFALMRAVPLHAGVFFGYEWFQRVAQNL